MKIFKILVLTLLTVPTTFAMEDCLFSTGQKARSGQTSRQAEHPELWGKLEKVVMKITNDLLKENETLKEQLKQQSIFSYKTQYLSPPLSVQKTSFQEDSLETEVDFVEMIFADLRRKLLEIILDLEQENSVLKHLLGQKEQSVEIEFNDGKKATYSSSGGFSFKGPVCLTGNFQMSQREVQYGGIRINLTLPLPKIAQELQRTAGIKRAVLRTSLLSCDQVFQREIAIFNESQRANKQSFQQHIDLIRNLYTRARQYQKLGSEIATKNIPILQWMLGSELANLSQNQKEPEGISSLREAVMFLDESARAGNLDAKRNQPIFQSELGIKLANLSQNQKEQQSISSLREAVTRLEESTRSGNLNAQRNLPITNFLLSVSLINSAHEITNVEICNGSILASSAAIP